MPNTFLLMAAALALLLTGCVHMPFLGQRQKYCVLAGNCQGKSIPEVQAVLEEDARRQYLDGCLKKDTGIIVSSEAARDELAKRIRLAGRKFYNGPEFGQLCLRANFSLGEKDLASFRLHPVKLRQFCTANPDVQVKNIQTEAERAAFNKLLRQFNEKIGDLPREEALKLLHDVKVKNVSFDLARQKCCLDVAASVVLYDVQSYKGVGAVRDSKSAPKTIPEESSPSTKRVLPLDLKNYHVGDRAQAFGDGIWIDQGPLGLALGSYQQRGAEVSFAVQRIGNFTLTLSAYYHDPFDLSPGGKMRRIISFVYDRGAKDQVDIQWKRTEQGETQANFITGNSAGGFGRVEFPGNLVSEVKIVKQHDVMSVYFNGQHRLTVKTSPYPLVGITVSVEKSDLVYAVNVEELKAE